MMPSGTRVLMAAEPVDFRKGPESLMALIRERGADPFSGTLYVFRSRRADRVKIVGWDGGVCLFTKRLEEGRFCWPRIESGVVRLASGQLAALVDGMDWTRVRVPGRRRPTSLG